MISLFFDEYCSLKERDVGVFHEMIVDGASFGCAIVLNCGHVIRSEQLSFGIIFFICFFLIRYAKKVESSQSFR